MATAAPTKAAVPVQTAAQRTAIVSAIQSSYKQSGVTIYGFSTTDIADFLFGNHTKVSLAKAEAVQRSALGSKQTLATTAAGSLISKSSMKMIAGGLDHLSQHQKGSHYSGDFNVGRMVSNVLGIITFGTAPDLTSFFSGIGQGKFEVDKIQFNVPFSAAHINKLVHDSTDFYGGQQFRDEFSRVTDSTEAKLAQMAIGATAAVVTGGVALQFGSLGTVASAGATTAPAGGSPALIGVSQASLNAAPIFDIGLATSYSGAGITSASLAQVGIIEGGLLSTIGGGLVTVAKTVGGAVVASYVQKLVGGTTKALQNVLQGNFAGAADNLVDAVLPGQSSGGSPAQASGGGYGGGGGGGGSYALDGSGTSSSLSWVPWGALVAIVLLSVYLYRKRK